MVGGSTQATTMMTGDLVLGVNIDHVATLRQARYAGMPGAPNEEPSLLAAAQECEASGAHGITIHLRADRRHIQDRDVWELREKIHTRMNLEMGDTPEILRIALKVKPHSVCLVPENRQEITTEGGLDVAGLTGGSRRGTGLWETIARLRDAGIRVSLFIDPDPRQVAASAETGAEMVELHTGAYANADLTGGDSELTGLIAAARQARAAGLQVNAGHGITLSNLVKLMRVPHLRELNVGHHLVSRALFGGLGAAVREMLRLMEVYPTLQAAYHQEAGLSDT